MPYINKKRREGILKTGDTPKTPGELNFVFSTVINEYLQNEGLNYSAINDVVGALECAKLEIYRRLAVPYEDEKITINGDVYDVPVN